MSKNNVYNALKKEVDCEFCVLTGSIESMTSRVTSGIGSFFKCSLTSFTTSSSTRSIRGLKGFSFFFKIFFNSLSSPTQTKKYNILITIQQLLYLQTYQESHLGFGQ